MADKTKKGVKHTDISKILEVVKYTKLNNQYVNYYCYDRTNLRNCKEF